MHAMLVFLCLGCLAKDEFLILLPSICLQIFQSWVIPHCVIYHIFFNHSSVEEHLGCFKFLAIMNKATMNISWASVFVVKWGYFGVYYSKRGIAGFWNKWISNFLRDIYINFNHGYMNFYSPQKPKIYNRKKKTSSTNGADLTRCLCVEECK